MTEDEITLINLIKAGQEPAFEYLFNTYYPALCLYARKLIGDLDKSKELSQDVFVHLYENREQLIITTSIKSYLYKSVHNKCLNYLKQLQIHNSHHTHLSYTTPESTETDSLLQSELEERLLLAISNLPGQCRKIFTMNRFEGKRNKEIALELGISIRTVETQISKALHILRSELTDILIALLSLSLMLM